MHVEFSGTADVRIRAVVICAVLCAAVTLSGCPALLLLECAAQRDVQEGHSGTKTLRHTMHSVSRLMGLT